MVALIANNTAEPASWVTRFRLAVPESCVLLLVVVIHICIPEVIASGTYAIFMFPIWAQNHPKIIPKFVSYVKPYHFQK